MSWLGSLLDTFLLIMVITFIFVNNGSYFQRAPDVVGADKDEEEAIQDEE